jgi:hypothetical protein
MTSHDAGSDGLAAHLDRWVAASLITGQQADRIASVEGVDRSAAASGPPAGAVHEGSGRHDGFLAPGRGGYVVEALGYLGGTLAAVAGFIAVNQLWPDIPTGAEIAFAAVGAVLLVVAGGLVQAEADPALARLRSVLWALSVGCVVAVLALLTGRVWDLSPNPAALLTAGVAALCAGVLWRLSPTPIQHLVLFAALAVSAGTAASWAADGLGAGQTAGAAGYVVWLFSAVWAVLALRAIVTPVVPGEVAAAAGMLIGSQFTMDHLAGNLLALLTVAALMAAGVLRREVWLLGLGALGVLITVPQVASRYLPASVAAPLAVFVVGVLLLAVAVWMARGRRFRAGPDAETPGASQPGTSV